MDISKGQVSWWQNHRDVGSRGCLKASWSAFCSDKTIASTISDHLWLCLIQSWESLRMRRASATLPSWWKIFLSNVQPKLFKSQFTTIVYIYISPATAKHDFALLLGFFFSFSSRCHRSLLDHTLPPLHQLKQTQIPQLMTINHVPEALGHPGGHLLGSFQFLIIPFDMESPEWDVSFQAGPHMH